MARPKQITFDLTQRARRDQFLAAREYLSRFPPVPMLIIPGNHDVPLYRVYERLTNPHGLFREIINEELNPVLRLERAVIVGLPPVPQLAMVEFTPGSWHTVRTHLRKRLTALPESSLLIITLLRRPTTSTIGQCLKQNEP